MTTTKRPKKPKRHPRMYPGEKFLGNMAPGVIARQPYQSLRIARVCYRPDGTRMQQTGIKALRLKPVFASEAEVAAHQEARRLKALKAQMTAAGGGI